MPVKKLVVENFKGVAARQEFALKPITIFLGANSSGKSSCIHALASLQQTLKLGNTTPSWVLDDDHAHVHLGRFAEISHTHSYSDPITVGIEIGHLSIGMPASKSGGEARTLSGTGSVHYSFRSTMRTQEVYVDSARLAVGDYALTIKRGSKPPYAFSATSEEEGSKQRFSADRTQNFFFRLSLVAQKESGEPRISPEWITPYLFLESCQKAIERTLRDTLYLGPFRQSPLRRYPFRGMSASEVGAQGEATITMLASEYVQAQDRPHIKQINGWLADMGLAKKVDVARVGTSDLFDVKLTMTDGEKLSIADLGYGLSQVLPVLTQCSFCPKGATLLFEQPELHLHENAAQRLAPIFVETAKKKEANVVLETHSKELVYEFLQLVRKKELKVEDIAIFMVRRVDGASQYTPVKVALNDGDLEVSDKWVRALTAG